ncbi:copper chaperone PCu(A)C [Sphingomonas sp.]|uniref:copper chaperone PCu(A)C n=1 Tax=Sphingomonas sp. TaxID=28214 RepID=UPI003F7277E0
MIASRSLTVAAVVALAVASAAAHDFTIGKLSIAHPWTRQTAPGQANGGGFMVISNGGKRADRLISARSPAAAKVEIHTMSMDGGIMRMRPVPAGLPVPAGGKLELKPGGYHIMLIGLKAPLKRGALVPLTLRFEHAGSKTVQLKVEAVTYGTGAGDAHKHH